MSLENGDFEGLSNLHELDVSFNPFTNLKIVDFEGLQNLQTLYLDATQITSIENGDFEGFNDLQVVSLRFNGITSIENGDFEGLVNLQRLSLNGNQIRSLENDDFLGLSNLQHLDVGGNQITSIEDGSFQGFDKLQILNLQENAITELNLTGATFGSLGTCGARPGFCVDSGEISDLILDHSVLNQGSFQSIIYATQFISNVSLVGLTFSDGNPANLSALLNIATLDNVRVDHALFNQYAAEFNAFDAIPGNTVTVVPEPSAFLLCTAASIMACVFHRRSRSSRSMENNFTGGRAAAARID
jgi:Leucine-rich repeat (LRR) protein